MEKLERRAVLSCLTCGGLAVLGGDPVEGYEVITCVVCGAVRRKDQESEPTKVHENEQRVYRKVNKKANNRDLSHEDEDDKNARCAELFFINMVTKYDKSKKKLTAKSIDVVYNPKLISNFEKKEEEFRSKSIPLTKVFSFHGTAKENIDSILQNNFDMSKRAGQAYGFGIYFSENPLVSVPYTRGCNSLIVCQILLGKSTKKGTAPDKPPEGYNSTEIEKDKDGNCAVIVIPNVDQILPVAVINF